MDEVWKEISDYSGLYEVSNLGRIKSADRTSWNGSGYFLRKGRILKQNTSTDNYCYVGLHKDQILKQMLVHRIVATTFIENPLNKNTINHKDGNKCNNSIDNLEWMTSKENSIHAVETGLINSQKAVIQFSLSGEILNEFISIKEASTITGITKGEISAVCNGNRKSTHGFKWEFKIKTTNNDETTSN